MTPIPSTARPESAQVEPIAAGNATPTDVAGAGRVLRNTHALLSMTLLFSAAIAAASVAFPLPAPGIVLTLGGYFGLLFAVYKFKNSGWALPAVFALTGFMGYSLGPVLARSLALPGGAQVVTMALAATGATFLALSAWVRTTRRDFNQEHTMKCPTCTDTALLTSDRQGVEIDYCPQCRGVWLDRGELDKLIERAGAMTPAAVANQATQSQPQFADSDYEHGRGPQGNRKKSWLGNFFD
jgi:Zn-finger nucleic acid-binding protein